MPSCVILDSFTSLTKLQHDTKIRGSENPDNTGALQKTRLLPGPMLTPMLPLRRLHNTPKIHRPTEDNKSTHSPPLRTRVPINKCSHSNKQHNLLKTTDITKVELRTKLHTRTKIGLRALRIRKPNTKTCMASKLNRIRQTMASKGITAPFPDTTCFDNLLPS
jgi:hypothetical protein